jgi:hypothetical protein
MATARWLDSTGSALLVEAEALRDDIRIIPEGTTKHIMLEIDSQDLVMLWKIEVSTVWSSRQYLMMLRR